ncbi:MAG: D-2-hydroxyacid dehydrogenase [Phycisphaerae bacterium]
MKIVVLDGKTLNPGDLTWDDLLQFGDLTVYDRTPKELVLERSRKSDILLTNKTLLLSDTLANLPNLKYIGVLATGYNVVDVPAAVERGITVTNVPAYSTNSVAQLTFALLLELVSHAKAHSDLVREGRWCRSEDFCFWEFPLIELAGKTMGVIGVGQIGKKVAQMADAFDMQILAYSRSGKNPPTVKHFAWASMDEVFTKSDVVSLHVPLTAETKELINGRTLAMMKKSAFLINTSRGGLVNENDLSDALNNNRLAGAGVDVLSSEPPDCENPLLSAKNCLITPHIAWATREARTRLMKITVENLRSFLAGKPVNVVRG